MSIGPFMENNKIMEGSSAEILMNQYKSVYTIPREEFNISKCSEMFNQYCSDCQAERTHICVEDVADCNILSNIFVDEDEIIAAIDKITPSESAGSDGIP